MSPASPRGTQLVAQIPNLLGPGMTGHMTYCRTPRVRRCSRRVRSRSQGRSASRPSPSCCENLWSAPPVVERLEAPAVLVGASFRLLRLAGEIRCGTMRRAVLALLIALVAVPAADAAGLDVRPREFSPHATRLAVKVSLPRKQRVGVQLATMGGRPLGWIVEPEASPLPPLPLEGLPGREARGARRLPRAARRAWKERRDAAARRRPDRAEGVRLQRPQPRPTLRRRRPHADDDLAEPATVSATTPASASGWRSVRASASRSRARRTCSSPSTGGARSSAPARRSSPGTRARRPARART